VVAAAVVVATPAAEDPAMAAATAAEEGVVATGVEATATLVVTPLGGNSLPRNCVCLDPFPSLATKK